MRPWEKRAEVVSLLSGKGGSGKTVIGLTLAKLLAQAEYSVLLVDLDLATHGATYFFEPELTAVPRFLSLHEAVEAAGNTEPIFETHHGFRFVPSSRRGFQFAHQDWDRGLSAWVQRERRQQDYIILDCQAGASWLSQWAAETADRSLVVLEADAVSSAAVRTLALELGERLEARSTWQVFNKLSEEERVVYEKVFGGTFFVNLPPLPFDWSVRRSFGRLEIPSLRDDASAFSLAVLRMAKTIFPSAAEQLGSLEDSTVGDWYQRVRKQLEELEEEARRARERVGVARARAERRQRWARAIALFLTVGTVVIMFGENAGWSFELVSSALLPISVVLGGAVVFLLSDAMSQGTVSQALPSELARLQKLDTETDRFRTLLTTDPRFLEYSKSEMSSEGESGTWRGTPE